MHGEYGPIYESETALGKFQLVQAGNSVLGELKIQESVEGNYFVLRTQQINDGWSGSLYTPHIRKIRDYPSIAKILQQVDIAPDSKKVFQLFNGEAVNARAISVDPFFSTDVSLKISNERPSDEFPPGTPFMIGAGLGLLMGLGLVHSDHYPLDPEKTGRTLAASIVLCGGAFSLVGSLVRLIDPLERGSSLLTEYARAYERYRRVQQQGVDSKNSISQHTKAEKKLKETLKDLEGLCSLGGILHRGEKIVRDRGLYIEFSDCQEKEQLVDITEYLLHGSAY